MGCLFFYFECLLGLTKSKIQKYLFILVSQYGAHNLQQHILINYFKICSDINIKISIFYPT